jgi:hypothetical protein
MSLHRDLVLSLCHPQWKDGNLLPVQFRVWGKGKQLFGACEGLQCFPDLQLSSNISVPRLKALQGGGQRKAAGQRRSILSGPFLAPPLWFHGAGDTSPPAWIVTYDVSGSQEAPLLPYPQLGQLFATD